MNRIVNVLVAVAVAGCSGPSENIANLDSKGSTIICFGDSLTRGHGAVKGQDYPSRLSKVVRRPIINAGRDGDTTRAALKRLDHDVLGKDPRIVIVMLGGNDALNRIPKKETVSNLDRIVARCVARGAMVVLVHGKYDLFKDPYRNEFELIAEKHGALFVPRVLKGVFGRPSLMSDQIHPNGQGYAVIAKRVAESLEPFRDVIERSAGSRAQGSNSL